MIDASLVINTITTKILMFGCSYFNNATDNFISANARPSTFLQFHQIKRLKIHEKKTL